MSERGKGRWLSTPTNKSLAFIKTNLNESAKNLARCKPYQLCPVRRP